MSHNVASGTKRMLLAGILASSYMFSPVSAQSTARAANPGATATPFRFRENRLPRRADMYYEGFWGVNSLGVKVMESGELIRFSYRVLDPAKAKPLNDKKSEPFLVDPVARVKLVIPSLEKVGQLRQSSTPQAGMSYWMAFSNKGRMVKRGDRVTVVIGQFRAEGLIVE